jgi:hypothetical protein
LELLIASAAEVAPTCVLHIPGGNPKQIARPVRLPYLPGGHCPSHAVIPVLDANFPSPHDVHENLKTLDA